MSNLGLSYTLERVVQLNYERMVCQFLHDSSLVHYLSELRFISDLIFLHDFHGIDEASILLPDYIILVKKQRILTHEYLRESSFSNDLNQLKVIREHSLGLVDEDL